MELLAASLLRDNFCLREKFPWISVGIHSKDYIHTCISRTERDYLADLMRPVLEDIESLKIERIQNPYLWGRYVLQYQEMKAVCHSNHVREQIMIHATGASNAYNIAEQNFNWRLVSHARFGQGVSFSKGVLVANSSPGDWFQRIPRNGEDTTTGFNPGVCIKYYDNDFHSYYMIQK